jgi:hypothetical protein
LGSVFYIGFWTCRVGFLRFEEGAVGFIFDFVRRRDLGVWTFGVGVVVVAFASFGKGSR